MTEKYTPEKVAQLIAEARAEGADWRENIGAMPLFDRLADALTAVTAERDAVLAGKYVPLADLEASWRVGAGYMAGRDRLHKAITEALDLTRPGASVPPGVSEARHIDRLMATANRILRASLDKEGNDDE